MVEKEKGFEDQEGSEDNKSSVYNEANLQINRLHNLWLNAEAASYKRNHSGWNSLLNACERELFADIEKLDDSKEIKKKLADLKSKYFKGMKEIKIGSMGMPLKGSNISPCMNALDLRHKVLKDVQERSGKGGIYRETDTDDMDD